jgi:hypothetical protein
MGGALAAGPFSGAAFGPRLGHGVVARPAPRMAAKEPPQGKPAALGRAVAGKGLAGVLRAGGKVTAAQRSERRDKDLVAPDQAAEQSGW